MHKINGLFGTWLPVVVGVLSAIGAALQAAEANFDPSAPEAAIISVLSAVTLAAAAYLGQSKVSQAMLERRIEAGQEK